MAKRRKKQMAASLRASLDSEKRAIDERFARAEELMAVNSASLKSRSHTEDAAPRPAVDPRKRKPPAARSPEPTRPSVLRRTFTLTEDEYRLIYEIKRRCNLAGFEAPQSEVLRAGLHALEAMDAAQLRQALGKLVKLRPGRTPFNF